jgi:hypothetical protein
VALGWLPGNLPSRQLLSLALNLHFDTVEIVSYPSLVAE